MYLFKSKNISPVSGLYWAVLPKSSPFSFVSKFFLLNSFPLPNLTLTPSNSGITAFIPLFIGLVTNSLKSLSKFSDSGLSLWYWVSTCICCSNFCILFSYSWYFCLSLKFKSILFGFNLSGIVTPSFSITEVFFIFKRSLWACLNLDITSYFFEVDIKSPLLTWAKPDSWKTIELTIILLLKSSKSLYISSNSCLKFLSPIKES